MKITIKFLLAFLCIASFSGCFEDNDDQLTSSSNVKDFVWKAMNVVYLYKDNVDDLGDDRFTSSEEYQDFLTLYDTPEQLFEALIYNRQSVDRFSAITNNYLELEQQLSGVSKSHGAEFNFYYTPGSSNTIFGVVRLVLPNSNADNIGLTRGQIFNKINGQEMTLDNISTLLQNDSYEIHLAEYVDNGTDSTEDDSLADTNTTLALTKSVYNENPVFFHDIIAQNNEKVGYLMYNGFTNEFDNDLNQVFGNFKSQNIDHLILDLRYNPGGSIRTAAALASMITGAFENQVFATLKYNETLSANNYSYLFSNELSNGQTINSLNLDRLYVITSSRSASASEMIINSLKAYIDVVHIGDETVGKSQASQIIYDSSNFGRESANPTHTYALLPLIAITVNKNESIVPSSGLTPDHELTESPNNYSQIGNIDEPLLNKALELILGSNRSAISTNKHIPAEEVGTLNPFENLMFVDF